MKRESRFVTEIRRDLSLVNQKDSFQKNGSLNRKKLSLNANDVALTVSSEKSGQKTDSSNWFIEIGFLLDNILQKGFFTEKERCLQRL